jgi:hypothetical protein
MTRENQVETRYNLLFFAALGCRFASVVTVRVSGPLRRYFHDDMSCRGENRLYTTSAAISLSFVHLLLKRKHTPGFTRFLGPHFKCTLIDEGVLAWSTTHSRFNYQP